MKKDNCGQEFLEYAVLFAVVLSAAAIIGIYIRNAVTGRMRDGIDVVGQGEVYRPHILGIAPEDHTQIISTAENTR